MKLVRATALLGLLVLISFLVARGPTPVEAQTPAFVGQTPARGSSGLLVVGTDSEPTTLIAGLLAAGCETASLAILTGGAWSVYVPGAPTVVNAAFPSRLTAGTPFFVRCTERLVAPWAPITPPTPTPAAAQAVDPSGWLSGSEQGAGTWNLPAGLVLVKFDYQGIGPFTIAAEGASEPLVSLTRAGIGAAPIVSTGAPITLRVSGIGAWEVGAFTGNTAFAESPGAYVCVAAATWDEVQSEIPTELDDGIWAFGCNGFDVGPPMRLEGQTFVQADFEGSVRFRAWLVDQQGSIAAQLYDAQGPIASENLITSPLPAGLYRLVVQTEGEWFVGLGELDF